MNEQPPHCSSAPRGLRDHMKCTAAKRRFGRLLSDELQLHSVPVQRRPPQSQRLTLLTAGREDQAKARGCFHLEYDRLYEYLKAHHEAGCDIRDVETVLNFGSGSARMLRLVGTDMNAECVEWYRANVPGAEFYLNGLEPPLAFPDAWFDLVIAGSVFPQIPLDKHQAWLRELSRVMRPGGVLLCTVIGSRLRKTYLGPEEVEQFESTGQVVLQADHPRASLSTRTSGLCEVYQTPKIVRRVLGRVFEILDYRDITGHDLPALRKPEQNRLSADDRAAEEQGAGGRAGTCRYGRGWGIRARHSRRPAPAGGGRWRRVRGGRSW
jgi:SAM-dependent methyltransferase